MIGYSLPLGLYGFFLVPYYYALCRYEMVRVTENTLEPQENGTGQFRYLLDKVDYNECFSP